MDSVRKKYIVELDKYKADESNDYSMNSLVKDNRRKKL